MPRYIDANKLEAKLAKWDWQDLYLPVHFKEIIDETPTADVREAQSGKWEIAYYNNNPWILVCSKCGERLYLTKREQESGKSPLDSGTRFCPGCGAKMDKEKNDGKT